MSEPKLTAADILAIQDMEPFQITVKQWKNATVTVRELDGKELNTISRGAVVNKRFDRIRFFALAVHLGCVDPVFTKDQALELIDKNSSALVTIGEAITEGKKSEDPAAI